MIHVVCFSGGKDSTALILWAKENLPAFTTVFCDTGWEHPITYAYIEEINRTLLGGSLVVLRSDKYGPLSIRPIGLREGASPRDRHRWKFVTDRWLRRLRGAGMKNLVEIKKRVPSAMARFCTSALKVEPMIAWLATLDDETEVYQGIRADESEKRAKMVSREWVTEFDAFVNRPLLHWSARDCFDLARKYGVKPNPLYLMGAGRVGCFPCVMTNLRELKSYLASEVGQELKDRVLELEALVGRSFFAPTYIPERFCKGFDKKSGKPFAWAEDVFRYIESVDEDQLPMFSARSCMSVYNLCE